MNACMHFGRVSCHYLTKMKHTANQAKIFFKKCVTEIFIILFMNICPILHYVLFRVSSQYTKVFAKLDLFFCQ